MMRSGYARTKNGATSIILSENAKCPTVGLGTLKSKRFVAISTLAVLDDAIISPLHCVPSATSRLENRTAWICGSASGAAMTGVGQSAGVRSAITTFEGTRGGTDAHPLVATHAMLSHVTLSQENEFLSR